MRKISPPVAQRHACLVSLISCLCLLLTALVPRAGVEAGVKKRPSSATAAEAAAPGSPPAANARPRAAQPTGPKTVGQWSGLKQLEDVPVHISLLPDGKLLYWGRDKAPDTWDAAGGSWSYVWNPETNQTQRIFNHTTNLFCSGHSFMSDGRLLVTGGHDRHPDPAYADIEGIGEVDVNIFDHVRNSWTLAAQMPKGRWYPFNVTLASGETAIFSGSYWDGTYQPDKTGRPVPKTVRNRSPEIFTRAGTLRQFSASADMKNYPYLHLAPNGNVLMAGPVDANIRTSYFDPEANNGQGSFTPVHPTYIEPWHSEGSAVMYDSVNGKVLMVGGTGGSLQPDVHIVPQARTIDLKNSPSWQFVSPMNYRRKYHTATLLADGKVLVTGGTQCNGGNNIDCPEGAAKSPELWDPQNPNGGWSVMAPNPSGVPRVYHSVALLLPDARVLVGGGGYPLAGGEYAGDEKCTEGQINGSVKCRTSGHKDAEIFSPPYLFDDSGSPAPRPVIDTAPRDVSYNTRFSITYSGPTNVDKVTWIRLPSVTHGFNQDQRIIVFDGDDITPDPSNPNKLSIKAPADPRQCPPGHYMMFALNSAGVPSVAKIIRVSGDQPSISSRVARNLDGKLMVFYRGSDNALHYFAQTGDAPDGPWSQPLSLTGGLASDPVAVANADGRIQVFAAIAGDGRIYSRTQTVPGAGTWSDWTAIPNTGLPAGEQFVSEPVAVRNWDGPLQLFARTSPGNLLYYTVQLSPGGAFDQWRPMSGAGISSPNVGVNRDGRVQMFVLGSDNRVWYRTQTVPGGAHTWTNWGVLPDIRPPCNPGCQSFSAVSKPTVARNDDGRLEVYARGTDNQMYIAWQTAPDADASWVWAWQPTGLAASNYPSVAPDAEGRLQVFVRSQTNELRFRRQLSANTSGLLQSPVNLAGNATTPPHAIRRADGRLEVFVRGADNQLHRNWQLAPGDAAWSGWQALGGSAANF